MSFSVQPETIIATLATLPSPALGPGQLREGALVFAADGPAMFWVNGDGITIPRTLVQVGGGSIVTGPVDIFVNSATGSDTAAGTAAAPFLTITRALQEAAEVRSTTGPSTIHLQNAGNFNADPDEVWTIPFMLTPQPPLRMVGVVTDSGSGVLTATGGTTGAFVPLTLGTITGVFPVGAFKKMYGTWLPGSANFGGPRFPIVNNTAGTITADINFAHIPLAGDQFTVGTPGSIIVGSKSLNGVGGPLLLDTVSVDVPQTGQSALHSIGLNWEMAYLQENGVTYLGHAGGTGSAVRLPVFLESGTSRWAPQGVQPSCGCIYDGSAQASGRFSIVPNSLHPLFSNSLFDTVLASSGKAGGPFGMGLGFYMSNIHYMTASSVTLNDGSRFAALGGLYNAMVPAVALNGIGPGCIAARNGSLVELQFVDFEASGTAAAGLISLDQSKGVLSFITGVNPAAKNVLEEHSASSCSVSGITATDVTGTSTGLIGGDAAAILISGVLPATNDLAAVPSQLCLVGAPT